MTFFFSSLDFGGKTDGFKLRPPTFQISNDAPERNNNLVSSLLPLLTVIVYLKRMSIKALKKEFKDKNFYDRPIVYYNCSMLSFHSDLK